MNRTDISLACRRQARRTNSTTFSWFFSLSQLTRICSNVRTLLVKQVAHTATEAQCLRRRENEIVNDGFRGAWTINMDHFKSGLDSQLTMIFSCNASLPPRYSMNETSRTQSKIQPQLARRLRMMFSPAAFRHCGFPRPWIGSHLETTDPLLELSQ